MNYRNFFLNTAMAALLAAPAYSFASPMPAGPAEGDGSGFYVKLQYNGEFFDNIGDFTSNTTSFSHPYGATEAATTAPPVAAHVITYKPSYESTYFAGGIAIGYSLGGPRVELEVLYSEVDVDDNNYANKEAAKWLSLAPSATAADAAEDTKSAFLTNDGFTNVAGMINAYYDIVSDDMPVAPYIGVGGGLTGIDFLGETRYAFAYQVKAGLGYSFNPQFKIFVGYRYFGVFGDEFDDIAPTNAGKGTSPNVIPAKVNVKNRYGMHGLEAGLIFAF